MGRQMSSESSASSTSWDGTPRQRRSSGAASDIEAGAWTPGSTKSRKGVKRVGFAASPTFLQKEEGDISSEKRRGSTSRISPKSRWGSPGISILGRLIENPLSSGGDTSAEDTPRPAETT